MPRKRLRVLIVSESPIIYEGLLRILNRPGITVVGKSVDLLEALRKGKLLLPDIFLLAKPPTNSLEIIRKLREELPAAQVVALLEEPNRELVAGLVRGGVRGCLSENAAPVDILKALRMVSMGKDFFGPRLLESLGGRLAAANESNEARLSPRELQVLQLVAEGLTSRAAALRLGVSIRTVETHRERMMSKLGVNNTASLLRRAIMHGLLDLKES